MNKQLLILSIIIMLSQMVCGIYFENQGCTEKTSEGFECKTCQNGFTLEEGLCRINDFNHTVKSDHEYYRVYVG